MHNFLEAPQFLNLYNYFSIKSAGKSVYSFNITDIFSITFKMNIKHQIGKDKKIVVLDFDFFLNQGSRYFLLKFQYLLLNTI